MGPHVWSDDSSFTAQAKIRKDFTAVELSMCKSVHMFHRQTRLLWELWCRTTYNSPDDPSPFWDHLVLLLPPAPTGSHLAQIRSRLAGQMADAHSTLSDPPRHLSKLEDYALTIGMPEGSSSESKVLRSSQSRRRIRTYPTHSWPTSLRSFVHGLYAIRTWSFLITSLRSLSRA